MIRKPLALLLAFVILFSSVVVNIPATEIVEGDHIISDYLSFSGVSFVYVDGVVYEEGRARIWVENPGHHHDGFVFREFVTGSSESIEISSTSYLEPGTYDIVLVGDYSDEYLLYYGEIDIALLVGDCTLTVTENQAPQPVSCEDLTIEVVILFFLKTCYSL